MELTKRGIRKKEPQERRKKIGMENILKKKKKMKFKMNQETKKVAK